MNRFKFIFISTFLLLSTAFSAFAYSSDDAIVQYVGSYTKYNFTKEWSNQSSVKDGLSNLIAFSDFQVVDQANLSSEAHEALSFAESNLKGYDTSDNNVYMSIITKEVGKKGTKGWIILTHCSSAEGFSNYIYSFSEN
mgnify:CR=1 FL=1